MKKCLPPPQVICPASEGQSHGNGTATSRPSGCRRRAHSGGQPPPPLQQGCHAEMLVPSPRPRTRVRRLPSPHGEVQPTGYCSEGLHSHFSTKGPYPPRRHQRSHRPGLRRGGGMPRCDPRLHLDDREGPRGSVRGAGRGSQRGAAMPPAGPGTGRRCQHRTAEPTLGAGGAWSSGGAEPREARPGRAGDGGGAAPRATFRRAEGPRRPRRRWYRMQIRRLTSEIMWGLA